MPLVNGGKTALLDAQASTVAGYYWALFTSNTTITDATVLSDLTEAAWTGYARQLVGSLNVSAISGGRAVATPVANPTFSNGSGGSQTFYVWGLVSASMSGVLLAADNLGVSTIPGGGTFTLNVSDSLTNG